MTIRVFHSNDRDNPHMVTYVAEVNTDSLDEAFMLTNSIEDGWWHNAKVKPMFAPRKGCRSTSVGDILSHSKLGRFRVLPVGFAHLRD